MSRIVILDNLRSAWNVGSVFRTACALSYARVVLCGVTIRPPSPRLRETSRGTEDHMPWAGYTSTVEGLEVVRSQGYRIVALEALPEATPIGLWHPPPSAAFVVGNEAKGLGSDILERCDEVVCLPMPGGLQSINVSCAFAAAAYIDAYATEQHGHV